MAKTTRARESPTFVNMGLNGQMPLRLDPATKAAVKALIELAYGEPRPGEREARRPSFSSFAGDMLALGIHAFRNRGDRRAAKLDAAELGGHRKDEAESLRQEIYGAADLGGRRGPRPPFSNFADHLILLGCDAFRKHMGLPAAAGAAPVIGSRRRHAAAAAAGDD